MTLNNSMNRLWNSRFKWLWATKRIICNHQNRILGKTFKKLILIRISMMDKIWNQTGINQSIEGILLQKMRIWHLYNLIRKIDIRNKTSQMDKEDHNIKLTNNCMYNNLEINNKLNKHPNHLKIKKVIISERIFIINSHHNCQTKPWRKTDFIKQNKLEIRLRFLN